MQGEQDHFEPTLARADSQSPTLPRLLTWLRARLLPGDDDIMLLAAYAMILTALITFVLQRPDLAPWRFYGVILSLSGLLALNMAYLDIDKQPPSGPSRWLFLLASATLFLLAIGLTLPNIIGFTPFLLYVIASQSIINLPTRQGLLFSLTLLASLLLMLIFFGISLEDLRSTVVGIGLGMVFTVVFSLVLIQYGRQKAHAEALLQQLQATNVALQAAREREKELAAAEERVRLAREIHDGLGHHLTVLHVQLQAAAKLVTRDPERAAQAIAFCREEAQAAMNEVRQSVASMRSTPLDGRSLDEAISALVHDFDRHSALAARFDLHGDPAPLPPPLAMTLYRAVQEGLTNAQKYAQAQHIMVTLDYAPTTVRLAVQDDGVGQGRTGDGNGFGLAGLRERTEQLGGSFAAGAQPGGGFLLELALPVETTAGN